jgi:hypothetical protein
MSDALKVTGICCSTVICGIALLLGEMEFAYASGGIIPLILGLPPLGRGLQKLCK